MPIQQPSWDPSKDPASQNWELEVTNRLNQLEYDLNNKLVTNDISSQEYDGRTIGSFNDIKNNPGSKGYFLDSDTGTVVMSNAIVRGDSLINAANIGGKVKQTLIAKENVILGDEAIHNGDGRITASNLISLGTRTYNTHSTSANQPDGTFARLSTQTLIELEDSSGTAYPNLSSAGTNTYHNSYYLMNTTNNAGNETWHDAGPFKASSSGYEAVIFDTRLVDGSPITSTAPLVLKQYSGLKTFNNTRVLTSTVPYDGKITYENPASLIAFYFFRGYTSSAYLDLSTVSLTATVSVTIYSTAKGSATVDNTTTYSDTITYTTGTVSGTNFESTTNGFLYKPTVDLSDWDDLSETDEVHIKLSITYTSETNFNGFDYLSIDSSRAFSVESDEIISNATAFIGATDEDKFALEVIGGNGLYNRARKVFEGELNQERFSGGYIIRMVNTGLISGGTHLLIRYKWNNGNSTDKNKTNSGYVTINKSHPKIDGGLEGDSDTTARIYSTNDGFFFGTGTDLPRETLGLMYDHDQNVIGVVKRSNYLSAYHGVYIDVENSSIGLKVTDIWILNAWR